MKTIVDTSAWIEYFRGGADPLDRLLSENNVLTHPIVIGELSCGNFRQRQKTLSDLKLLPKADEAAFDETLELIEEHRLHGRGLGFADVQLLASALISGSALLSLDRAVVRAAREMGIPC